MDTTSLTEALARYRALRRYERLQAMLPDDAQAPDLDEVYERTDAAARLVDRAARMLGLDLDDVVLSARF